MLITLVGVAIPCLNALDVSGIASLINKVDNNHL